MRVILASTSERGLVRALYGVASLSRVLSTLWSFPQKELLYKTKLFDYVVDFFNLINVMFHKN